MHEVNILSVVQYKWPNQFDYKALARSDYREHYIFGDSILVWEKFAEENQYLGKIIFDANKLKFERRPQSIFQIFRGRSRRRIAA